MIELYIVVGLALLAAGLLLIQFGFVPPPHADILLRLSDGRLELKRGQLLAFPREQAASVLGEAGVTRGYIAITPAKRVFFSRSIPAALHQRLRNILLNP